MISRLLSVLHSCLAPASLGLGLTLMSCAVPPQPEPETFLQPEQEAENLTPLIAIEAGLYRPLYPGEGEPKELARAAFFLEETPVTNAQFLAFVRANPKWQRDRVSSLMADSNYLQHWDGNLVIPAQGADAPVTRVSWFAARAYAQWIGRRLPTLAEWESIGMSSVTAAYGREDPSYNQKILNWYSRPTPPIPDAVGQQPANYFGVHDMHGLIWEWVEDFNSSLITGESRGDSGLDRNLFCGSASVGVADPSDYAAFMRFAFRSSLEARFTVNNLGFRCAADAPTTR